MNNLLENKIVKISYNSTSFGFLHNPLRLTMPFIISVEVLFGDGSKKNLKLSSFQFEIEDFDPSCTIRSFSNYVHSICSNYKKEFDNFIESILVGLLENSDLEVSFKGKIDKEKKLELQLL